ncbi:unnamed protein product [Owenia fusiformis]|uniref:Uncharacterized protein n=1 Tax=Owenia fusiformis TaxID=6347 RepID=A0A8J1TJE2_OWEFU|nr:unnamed protein product [Owenia fusiformis]
MARRDLSRTFSEFESDELTLDTTDPTDISVTLDSDFENGKKENKKPKQTKVTKQLIEYKQMKHDIQLLKIELSQKELLMDNLKADHMQKVEELEEQLNGTHHQKQILQARLETQLRLQEEESRKRQSAIKRQYENILEKQKDIESANKKLQARAYDARRTLQDIILIDEEYEELKSQNEENLSLRDFVAVRVYESLRPLKIEVERHKSHIKQLQNELQTSQLAIEECDEKYQEEHRAHENLKVSHQRLTLQLADTQTQIKQGDYKLENYDRVKLERDELEHDLMELKKRYVYIEASLQTTSADRADLSSQTTSAKQSIALLTQDKDYLSKQVSDLTRKSLYAEEKLDDINTQLETVKKAREELYEKYMHARDQYKSEYEMKLREQLDEIRVRTNTEIDRLKTSTREMYERENRSLREARDSAQSERDRAVLEEKNTSAKLEQLMNEYRQQQINGDNALCETQNDLKMKAFEIERTQMVYEETLNNFKNSQLDIEKLQKKLEVLTKEYYAVETSRDKEVSILETQLKETKQKLETYEKLESELDDVVMQAAEIDNESEAERVLFSYGYGANVPSTAKRRLQQSVHLARRVLQLERANSSLRQEIQRETSKVKQLSEEVKNLNEVLDEAQQPYNYLVGSIRSRDSQLQQKTSHISSLEEDVRRLEKERIELTKSKNQMAADLERLLNQKEEMALMKQVVRGLHLSRHGNKESSEPIRSHNGPIDPDPHRPDPTVFTNTDNSQWYKQLKQRSHLERSKYSTAYETR